MFTKSPSFKDMVVPLLLTIMLICCIGFGIMILTDNVSEEYVQVVFGNGEKIITKEENVEIALMDSSGLIPVGKVGQSLATGVRPNKEPLVLIIMFSDSVDLLQKFPHLKHSEE